MTPKIDLPPGLISAIKERRAVLFLGAGASLECVNGSGKNPPSALELRDLLCDKFFEGKFKEYDLKAIADFAISQHGKANTLQFIADSFIGYKPSEAHKIVTEVHWRSIATTNYDTILEQAYYDNQNRRLQNLVKFVKDSEPIVSRLQSIKNPVVYLKLHGCLDHIHDESIPLVLSHDGYDTYSENRARLFNRLEDDSYESTIIFCGYQLGDAHIRKIINKICPLDIRPMFYIVCPKVAQIEKDYWLQNKVTVIDAKFSTFMSAIDHTIPYHQRKLSALVRNDSHPIKRYIPSNKSIPGTVENYLTKDAELVYSEMETIEQSPSDFYRGLEIGFGCIRQNLTVKRGVVEDVLYKILEDDSVNKFGQLLVLKGPAGNGKTIALKQVGWQLATELKRLVLFLRDGGAINWETLYEIISLTGERAFLLVDRAAYHCEEILNTMQNSSKMKVPLTIVTTETDSEWFNYCTTLEDFGMSEFRVRYLSHNEIISLLEKLRKHDCLGVLKDLPEKKQIERFEETAERQLLVALHEATQGKRFEEIVLDEYNRISPMKAQSLYLDICTMNQFDVGARAGNIRRISNIKFSDYKDQFFKPLESIVHVNRDPYTGDMMYKARHSRIANLVFRGVCKDDTRKAKQLIRILRELDIGYSSDSTVFSRLIKGHSLVRNMQHSKAVRSIYEQATKVAPEAFVYQQWAIFESTHIDGSHKKARQAIEKARALAPGNTTIIHTQAEVARKAAKNVRAHVEKKQLRDVCREHLAELKDDKNRYKLASRVKLLIDEFEEIDEHDDTKAAEAYANKLVETEILLTKAQQIYPDDSEFFECEARIKQITEDGKKANIALEKAIKLGAQGDGIWVRLAKGYAHAEDEKKEYATLEQALEKYPSSKIVHASMAHALARKPQPDFSKMEKHLAISYDNVDSNFEARYNHAQCLFLLKHYQESKAIFDWINLHAPSAFRRLPSEHPGLFEKHISLQVGQVTHKTESFLFVTSSMNADGLYANEASSDEKTWDSIRVGMQVSYRIQFNRRGPQAVRLSPV